MHGLRILALVALSFPGTSSVPQVSPTQVEFASEDKLTVTADLYAVANRDAPTIVLVHQSGSSRGEYRQIAPALTRLGFNALAVDIRWGHQDKWNAVMNKTAERFGTPAILVRNDQREMRSAQEASLNDIRGAVRWLRAQGYSGSKLLWGASISANMVLEIAAESQEDVAAVLAFSPGEYHPDQPNEMKTTVANLRVPTLIVCGAEEQSASRPIFEAIRNDDKKFYQAAKGHGSSILLDDTSNWEPVISFVKRFGPGRSEHGNATLVLILGRGLRLALAVLVIGILFSAAVESLACELASRSAAYGVWSYCLSVITLFSLFIDITERPPVTNPLLHYYYSAVLSRVN